MITIVTPTYNRLHTLPRLFESLCHQRGNGFEWVVIDDGSIDGTNEYLDSIQVTAPFPVIWKRQDNAGKHIAINTGVELATYEWVFIVDSDDALDTDALSIIGDAIEQQRANDLVGLCFRKKLFSGELVGLNLECLTEPLDTKPTIAGSMMQGDLAYVFKKQALLQTPFPLIEGERFVPELYIWNKISDLGRILFYPSVAVYFCDYLEDGYSQNFRRNLMRNPRGFRLFYMAQISREASPVRKLKCIVRTLQCTLYTFMRPRR